VKEYHVGKVLGRGSFGTVYEAQEKGGEKRKVALKIMKKMTIRTKGLLSRVLREIKIHRPLKHPNIVSLLHYFEDKRVVCLVLELCPDGQTVLSMLREHVKSWETEREQWAKRIIRDVANGLAYLHDRGIVHRDVKLSNLLWFPPRRHGKWGIVKIADFGLARKMGPKLSSPIGDEAFMQRSTPRKSREMWVSDEHGTVCGTLDYMSPYCAPTLNS
jgi:serine/threonine protein kinase